MQTLTSKTLREYSRVPRATLQQWVSDGDVVPVERGGPGRGRSDRYRYGQALGLIMAQALRETSGCNLEQVRRWSATSDEEFLSQYHDWQSRNVFRDEGDDPWADEEGAIAKHRLAMFDVVRQELARLYVERSSELFAYYQAQQQSEEQSIPVDRPIPNVNHTKK